MKKKPVIILTGAVLLIAGTVTAIIMGANSGPPPPPPEPKLQTAEDRAKYLASDNFKNLTMDQKKEYMKKSMENGSPRDFFRTRETLNEDEQKKLRSNMREVFQARRQEQVDEYFDKKTQQEKLAYLDKYIDERTERFKKMREQFNNMSDEEKAKMRNRGPRNRDNNTSAAKGKDGEKKGEPRRRGPSLDRIKNRIESTDPKERAKATEFRMAVRARMQQRGIESPWGRHGGGGGGGGGGRRH